MLWRSLNEYTQELGRVHGCSLRWSSGTGGYVFEYADYVFLHIFSEKRVYKVGKSSRDGDVFVEFVSLRFDAAERWFIRRMGDIHRSYKGLSAIKLPSDAAEVRSGYEVRALGVAWSTLDRSGGTVVPIKMTGDFTGKYCPIVELSLIHI